MLDWLFPPPRHGAPVRALLDRTHTIDISRCADGERHRITGVADGDMALTSPITGRPCLFWAVVVDEVGSGDWVERGADDDGAPFLVRDGSGIARVVPLGARTALPKTCSTYTSEGALHPGPRAMFVRLAIKLNYPQTSRVRFNEYIISAGDRITVVGSCQLEPTQNATTTDADATGYRGTLPMQPVFSGSRRKPLLIGHA